MEFEEYEDTQDLQKHKEEKHNTLEEFRCGECEWYFKSEKKRDIHEKIHEKFECNEWDKTFKYEGLLDRHVDAVHSDPDFIIYCHYYNNEKECPFGYFRIYEHNEADKCNFGKACERVMCMYKHNDEDTENDGDNDVESDCSDVDIDKIRPILEKVKKGVEKCDNLIEQCSFNCKFCDFEAKDKNGLAMHTRAKHPTKAD